MLPDTFYNDHCEEALAVLKELREGLAASCRVARNDAFEYVILIIFPPPAIAFFGYQYFMTIRMEQGQFKLVYDDRQHRRHTEFFPDLARLRTHLQALKPDLQAMIQQWHDTVEEWLNAPDES